jgi:hypothetical protein
MHFGEQYHDQGHILQFSCDLSTMFASSEDDDAYFAHVITALQSFESILLSYNM